MKKFLGFIALLASNSFFACGFYPYGEELRFSFFNPDLMGYHAYSEFYYSANSFMPGEVYRDFDKTPNELLWVKYCKNKVSYQSVQEVMMGMTLGDIQPNSKNEMLLYLYRNKDFEAINYLKFAKNCEFFNSWMEDPWERNEVQSSPVRKKLLNQAIQLSQKTKNETLKFRYTFLAIRMAFYSQDVVKIRLLFDNVFKVKSSKDILFYWSLYFRALAEEDKALANFYAAQVFVNAPEKRFAVSQYYNKEVPIEQVLTLAKTDEEKANIYLIAGILKHDKSLDYLKKVYEYRPKFDGLSFMLMREMNKIEDWVFTPYYSLFEPSVETNSYWDEEVSVFETVQKRVESDRNYAGELLQFINNINLNSVENPVLWKTCKAHLLFMTKDYNNSITLLNELEKVKSSELITNQIQIIKALALTANQEYGKAILLDEVKPVILRNKNYQKFLFALGRELEFKGNTSDAALLYANLGKGYENYYENHDYYNSVYWKSVTNSPDNYSDFYTNYFDYINVMYTPGQVEALINNIIKNRDREDEFSVFKYSVLKTELPLLYDLLGTKYIRQNKLTKAMKSFKKVDVKLWNEKYSNWERSNNGWYYGGDIFDQNPFYVIKYTPEFIPIKDTVRINKYTVTRQLIKYINKAENPKEKNKDYYYFLVGNCYYNMTHYGNAWMMRRYYWTGSGNPTSIEDEREYHQCLSAKTYYLLALKNAKTDKFKALCLRMIARCEANRLKHLEADSWEDNHQPLANKYYMELKEKYPNYYDELTSNCDAFGKYFSARR
jgi:hypothetical protein